MTAARCRWVIVAAVLLVFGRLLLCDFTWWDDPMTLHHNPQMNPVKWDTFAYNWAHPSASIYIPLTYTVWALLAIAARVTPDETGIALNPTVFHGANLLIHLGGALAAFALLRRLVKNDTAALLGALLWALHPVQVESVGWVSGLKDVLSGSLVLASLTLYLRWRQADPAATPSAVRRHWPYVAALLVYALAMLAKPAAFTMPLLLVLIDRLIVGVSWKKTLAAVALFGVLTVPIAIIARAAQPSPASGAPAWVRPLVAGDTLAFYALKVIAPIELTFDYGRNIEWLRTRAELYYAWLLPAAVAAVVAAVYRRARRARRPLSPLPAAGLLIFVLAPVHVLGLVRFDFQTISVVADHYLYVAMIGPALLLAWAVARWPRAVPAAAVFVVALGARAAWQTPVWQNEDSLMRHTLSVNPRSWTAHTNLSVQFNKTNNSAAEKEQLELAYAIRPDDPTVCLNLLYYYVKVQDYDTANAYARKVRDIYRRVWLPAGLPPEAPYFNIVPPFIDAGRFDDAARYLNEAQALAPGSPRVREYVERLEWARKAAARNGPTTR